MVCSFSRLVLAHLKEDSCLSPHLPAGTSYANAEQALDTFLDGDGDFNDVSDSGCLKPSQLCGCASCTMPLQHTIPTSSRLLCRSHLPTLSPLSVECLLATGFAWCFMTVEHTTNTRG